MTVVVGEGFLGSGPVLSYTWKIKVPRATLKDESDSVGYLFLDHTIVSYVVNNPKRTDCQ